MPPVVSIIGKSNSGKTTLVEKLVKELRSRGYRVATAKHTPQGASFDEPDKDSWRHISAGSAATCICSPDKVIVIKSTAEEATLEELARLTGEDYDIIIAEGFKQGDAPKVEVHRKKIGPPLQNIKKLTAIVTDEPLEARVRQFSPEDTRGLADLIEEGFVKPQQERISLYVNRQPVPLTSFPKQIVTNLLLAMADSLKGVGEIRSLDISLRRNPENKDR
ncbi:molybdopterin-guanine dinucleotide biosynthesis protein B [Chloroflexota bacterium]